MKIDIDLIQRVKVIGIFSLQIYKVVTGCMLTLFIPQNCDGDICTLHQNYENNEIYHKTTLYLNALCLLSFLVSYGIELKRENWAIEYLDIDNDVSDNSLRDIIKYEPILETKMDKLNKYYFYSLVGTSVLYGLNVCMMGKIISTDYHSSSTLSCFVSFVLLVLMKLYNSLTVAYNCVKHDKMMSAYMSEFVSFNVLDADYLRQRQLANVGP